MADEFATLTTALASIRTLVAAIHTAIADAPRAGEIAANLEGAVFRELAPCCCHLRPEVKYQLDTMPGPTTVAAVKDGYGELSAL